MAPVLPKKLEVWRYAGTRRLDLGGVDVEVAVFARKVLGPVVGRRQYDNGYEKIMTEVRQDRQGRTYHKHVQIDYYSPTSWWRDEDRVSFYQRPKGHKAVAVDVLGRRLDSWGQVERAKPLDNWCAAVSSASTGSPRRLGSDWQV